MPFPICRHRQRGIDKRHDLLRKIRRAAIADPLRIATIHQETCSLESRHVAGHAGLAGAEFPHQFANTMLAPIPHHPKGFEPGRLCEGGKNRDGIHIYPVHVTTRKSLGLMMRKLSVTESQRSAQFRGTFSRRKPSVASANWAQVA